jgi:hypothetical protein
MRCIFRRSFIVSVVFLTFLLASAVANAEPLKFTSSTQFLWGDDLLGESQQILAQYLRMSYLPEGKTYSITGYGRVWKDFGTPAIRDNDVQSRLYYLYLDYTPIPQITTRIGRQFTNFTAGTSLMDGVRLDVKEIGPVGITIAGGRDIIYTLDSEVNRDGNYFVGVDVHLQGVKNTQLGISYARKYDESDLAREALGMNFRYNYKIVSPYVELKYDVTSEVIDEATVGLEVTPMDKLLVKGEFYHSYPTFDATSIYSVFAVDKYREYMISAEYKISTPVSVFATYVKQTYEEDSNADVFRVGARLVPVEKLSVNASVDYRHGFGGNLWGFEVTGDYRVNEKIGVAAGVQYDSYKRPDVLEGTNDAQRYWLGGRWIATKNISVTARIEENVNENFDHRTLGRVALNWNL